MRFKKVVTVAMYIAEGTLGLILLIGLVAPASFLDKLSGSSQPSPTAGDVTFTADGKKVVETVNPATGEITTQVVDPKTGAVTTDTSGASGGSAVGSGSSTSTSSNSTGQAQQGSSGSTGGGGTTPAASKPVVTVSLSPTTITAGGSATLGWGVANSPSTCTASGAWSGSKPASGTVSVTAAGTYSLTCSNAGGTGSDAKTLTVNQPVAACGSGGACHLSDIQSHNTSSDCRSAINKDGTGMGAYQITASFLSLHQSKKSITNMLCGKVYGGNLRGATADHRGPSLGGSNYDAWMSNFYIGTYN